MGEICNDNRFELIEKYKNRLIESTNIETSKKEMDVIDNILFRCWQLGWLETLEEKEKYAWHDLRKNPKDLPDEGSYVLICIEHLFGTMRMYSQCKYYEGDFMSGYNIFEYSTDIIGWKYLDEFEKEW